MSGHHDHDKRHRLPRITRARYEEDRRHGCAGPISELMLQETRDLYQRIGADAWQVAWSDKGTCLQPVVIED